MFYSVPKWRTCSASLGRKRKKKNQKIMADLGNFANFSSAKEKLIRRKTLSAADERVGRMMKYKKQLLKA